MTSLSRTDALQRFYAERVVVLGTVDKAGSPHLVPVTFAQQGDGIVFAVDHKPKTSSRLRRLDNIEMNPMVSFLADEYDDDWDRLWWVRINAAAHIVTSGEHHQSALDALAAKYHQYREFRPTGVVVRSRITAVVGWTALRLSRRMPQ